MGGKTHIKGTNHRIANKEYSHDNNNRINISIPSLGI